AVVDEVAADAGAGRDRGRGRGGGRLEGDGLAVDRDDVTVGELGVGLGRQGSGGAVDQRAGRDVRSPNVLHRRAREGAREAAEGGAARGRIGAACGAVIEHVAAGDRAGEAGGAAQVGGGGAGDRGGHVRFARVADLGLQRLVGDRLGGVDQRLQRGDAGVGGLQHLHAVADAVQQVADVAGARIERLGGEEVGRIVEGRVHLLAGGQPILGGGEKVCRGLQREQVLANRGGKNDTGRHCGPSYETGCRRRIAA